MRGADAPLRRLLGVVGAWHVYIYRIAKRNQELNGRLEWVGESTVASRRPWCPVVRAFVATVERWKAIGKWLAVVVARVRIHEHRNL